MRVRRVCAIEECEGRHVSLGLCSMHYCRLKRWGDPYYVTPIQDYDRSSRDPDTNLPNPWAAVAPPCPHCLGSEVFLWAAQGPLRWFCQPCRRRFDVAPTLDEFIVDCALDCIEGVA